MELWDIYDEERRKTGRTAIRDVTPLAEGEYHLVVHVCVFSSDGKMLIQRRAQEKNYGGLWDVTAGGSALAGETSKQAAERELMEEMGISLRLPRPSFTANFERGFNDVFLTQADIPLSSLVFQKEEVSGAKWATREEVFQMLADGTFVPFRKCFLEMIFGMNGNLGILR